MILSIIVISHNQKDLLRRCLDSILAQDLPFEHEIIVSDDASTDGTWDLIHEYQAVHPEVRGYQCNSDDCNPANNSQRSGWNRCNAYPHATGKYIAHVDGDDYFRPGADVLRKQVEALEKHPECSVAMSDVIVLRDGDDLICGKRWHKEGTIKDGRIIDGKEFIDNHLFIINQACIQRRNPDVNPIDIYGKRYVDSVITYHHLQYGKIICVDACDYVYVQQPKSVTGEMSQTRDTMVIWCLGLYIPILIPKWKHDYLLADYQAIRDVVSLARQDYQLQEKNKKSLEGLGVYIYDYFNRPHTIVDKCRLFLTTQYMRLMHACGWKSKLATNILYTLLCKE